MQIDSPKIPASKLKAVATTLLQEQRPNPENWTWVGDAGLKRLTKKRANKFLFTCIINYQVVDDPLWGRCAQFVEGELGDPQSLWDVITAMPLSVWLKKTKKFGLHRFPKAHERLWTIGKRICDEFDGDARQIWKGRNASETQAELERLGVGQALSRMTTGALIDTGWVKGRCDVKPDVYVRRIIGRLFVRESAPTEVALELARRMHPKNPWRLDSPLFKVGKNFCRASNPRCCECPLTPCCAYAKAS